MADLIQAADQVRKLNNLFAGLSSVIVALDQIGSLENAANEAITRHEAATTLAIEAEARLAEVQAQITSHDVVSEEVRLLGVQRVDLQTDIEAAKADLGRVRGVASDVLTAAKAEANATLTKAQEEAQSVMTAAQADAAAIIAAATSNAQAVQASVNLEMERIAALRQNIEETQVTLAKLAGK